jgi:two-component system, OmpR family, sensor kinase
MSWRPERRAELAWGAFCVACSVGMLVFPQWQTVPFHWIWITITILYGFRRWTIGQTAGVLGAVIVVTTIAMLRAVGDSAELSEVPLMTCVFLAMVWHVRRRQEAVDELRRVAEREREFMRDAAHTLRTPLTVAQGHAEFVLADLDPAGQSYEDATVLLDELRRLARISNQLLLLAAADHADALLLAPVSLDRLAQDAGRRWRATSTREIAVDAPEPVVLLADEHRLRHALDALVENAINATASGGTVTISAHLRDGGAALAVSDTGTGIAATDLERVFERFCRGRDAESRPGTGLGLPIVKAITETHGGTATVDSRPGAGTTVTLRLGAPVRADRPAPGLSPVADARAAAATA